MVKIQEPSSSIRETERKESPEWQCTSVPPLEGTREWQNPVTTTFILARLECGFQQGGGAVSFVTRERHSLLPRHPFLEFLPPRLPCLALLAWLSSCWYLHPIVAPTTFVSSSSFSLFLSLSFFLCFSLRLRPGACRSGGAFQLPTATWRSRKFSSGI